MGIYSVRHRRGPSASLILRRQQDGFAYAGTLFIVAILSLASTASLQLGSVLQRRIAENELLDIGAEFQRALQSYANATPAGQARAPAALQDLLKDPRYPQLKRHLRKLYIDPLTGKANWGTVPAADGRGIGGAYSIADGRPIKNANFGPPFAGCTVVC